jgi:glycosyltransferase involved in cell wall biosynthesis
MRISLITLTKNERVGVEALIPKLPRDLFDEVLCVDGGSKDGTREYLASQGLRVIDQTSPGRGEAFRIARRAATGDAMLFFSPDGNESLDDLGRFRPLLEGGADIVIASRMMRGAWNEEDGEMFRPRKWANNSFNGAANLLWNRGAYVTDSINGYRAITTKAFDRLQLDSTGYTIEYQMTIRAMKLGLKIVEFPTREGSRIGGESGAPSIPTGLRFLRLLWSEIRNSSRFSS